MHKFLEKSFELVQMWDAWGVNMRPTGDWECKGHALPGKPRAFLKYDGSDQKKVLVREAKAVGVKFYNHHPVVELARVGDRIAGALAVDISTGTARLCPGPGPKAVLLATGLTHRLYMNASTPGFMFNTGTAPTVRADRALAGAWARAWSTWNSPIPTRAPSICSAAARRRGSASTAIPTASPSAPSPPSPIRSTGT